LPGASQRAGRCAGNPAAVLPGQAPVQRGSRVDRCVSAGGHTGTVSTERNNTIDGLLVFVLLLAAWAVIETVRKGKYR